MNKIISSDDDIVCTLETILLELTNISANLRDIHNHLCSFSAMNPSAAQQPEYMTLEELQRYIPGDPDVMNVLSWIRNGLPSQMVNNKYLFRKELVDEWLKKWQMVSAPMNPKEASPDTAVYKEKKQSKWIPKQTIS